MQLGLDHSRVRFLEQTSIIIIRRNMVVSPCRARTNDPWHVKQYLYHSSTSPLIKILKADVKGEDSSELNTISNVFHKGANIQKEEFIKQKILKR